MIARARDAVSSHVGTGGVGLVGLRNPQFKVCPESRPLFFHGMMFVLVEMFVFVVVRIAINVGIRAISTPLMY